MFNDWKFDAKHVTLVLSVLVALLQNLGLVKPIMQAVSDQTPATTQVSK